MTEQRATTEMPELEARLVLARVTSERKAFAPLPQWPLVTASLSMMVAIVPLGSDIPKLGVIGTSLLWGSLVGFAFSLLFIVGVMSRKLSALSDLVSRENRS
jgi:hypothetical protein